MTYHQYQMIFYKRDLPPISKELMDVYPEPANDKMFYYLFFMMFLLDMTLEEAWDYLESALEGIFMEVVDDVDNSQRFQDTFISDCIDLYAEYYMLLHGMIYHVHVWVKEWMVEDIQVIDFGPDSLVVTVFYKEDRP